MIDIIENFAPSLCGLSVLTGLVVEALKKTLDGVDIKYSSNILAGIVSLILSGFYCAFYVVINEVAISPRVVCYGLAFVFMSWLTSMVGFDKVKQIYNQLGGNDGNSK